MNSMKHLSIDELLFIDHYIEHRNPVDALRAADEKWSGYSESGLKKLGDQMLAKAHVSAEIERRIRVHAMASAVTQAEIVDELRKVAMFDMRQLFDVDGQLKPIHELDDDTARGLSHFEIIQCDSGGHIMKSVPANKLKALELLGKHRRMFIDRVEQTNVGPSVNVTIDWIKAEDAPPPAEDGSKP
jgi:phage terminase small subunit